MAEGAGFTSMAAAAAEGSGRRSASACWAMPLWAKPTATRCKKIPYMMYPPPAIPKMVAICGRNEAGHQGGGGAFWL